MKTFWIGAAAILATAVVAPVTSGAIDVDVTLERIDDDRLRVEWIFSERIQGLQFGEGIEGWRAAHWTLDEESAELVEGARDRIVSADWFDRLAATVTM